MALKALLLRQRIDRKKAELEALREKDGNFRTRETELETAIGEAGTEEDQTAVEALVDEYTAEKNAHEGQKAALEREVSELESQLAREEAAQDTTPPQTDKRADKREDVTMMIQRDNNPGTLRERISATVQREDVKTFLSQVRDAMSGKRSIDNVGLTIPDVHLELIRYEVARSSRLLPHVRLTHVSGKARQNITGAIPEAVWTEMCASINEMSLGFHQMEVDGYKVAGYVPVCNAALEDSDVALAGEIITVIGAAIGKALDKAILFGTGTKMPTGIVTRLNQESQPANWGTNAPAWTDLHSSNIITLNIDGSAGAAFFSPLVEKLGVAKPRYGDDGLFWVMNRKTHLHILAKALAFNAAAALVSNTDMMPVIGGTIVEFEDDEIQDNTIYGGYGCNYLLAERAGVTFASSDIPLFIQDQTVFKGTARYDGKPVAGEAFVVVNFANTSPDTEQSFPADYANSDLNDLTITAAAGSAVGKTVLTVSGTVAQSNPVLKYRLGTPAVGAGDTVTGWDSLTSGSTAISAAAGRKITVVELDGNGRVVSAGVVISVPKTS